MSTTSQPPPLPGFGLPLNYIPKGDGEDRALFPNALDPDMGLDEREWKARMPVLTLREIAMVQLMNQATDIHDWEHKVFDDAITQKWKTEALQSLDFTQEMIDYCIEELKYTAELYAKTRFLKVYNGDVIKSDAAIPTELQVALKAAITPLENVPAHKQDWHPGSGDKVLDLTVSVEDCISRCGQGELIPEPPEDQATIKTFSGVDTIYSRKFQWLPCDVDISGNTPKIISYINNLHPQDHTGLYNIIEKIIEKVIPLWNATLTPLRNSDFPRRIEYKEVDYGDLNNYAKKKGPKRRVGEEKYDFWERRDNWKNLRKNEFIVRPNPPPFIRPKMEVEGEGAAFENLDPESSSPKSANNEPSDETSSTSSDDWLSSDSDSTTGAESSEDKPRTRIDVDLKVNYGPTGLQVIVKLANIHLTPEKPEYEGSTWHVEGQLNEHICATAIYYYDTENITSSHLAFRQPSDVVELEEDLPYEQSDWAWLEAIYGLQNDDPAVQVVGSVEARKGRVVTFPNILQHQVQPFKLADPTKPGHRKILALFLVDPNIRVISTANIPCQQRDWWGRTLTSSGDALARLPAELREKVINDVEDFPITLERAKELREELMAERKAYVVDYQTENFNSVAISLCEH